MPAKAFKCQDLIAGSQRPNDELSNSPLACSISRCRIVMHVIGANRGIVSAFFVLQTPVTSAPNALAIWTANVSGGHGLENARPLVFRFRFCSSVSYSETERALERGSAAVMA